MLPGVVLPGGAHINAFGKLAKGDCVSVNLTTNQAPVAVGVAAHSSHDMYMCGGRGKCVITLHFVGDLLWSQGAKYNIPELGPPPGLDLKSLEKASSEGDEDEEESDSESEEDSSEEEDASDGENSESSTDGAGKADSGDGKEITVYSSFQYAGNCMTNSNGELQIWKNWRINFKISLQKLKRHPLCQRLVMPMYHLKQKLKPWTNSSDFAS